jgi:REase_AHJR-like
MQTSTRTVAEQRVEELAREYREKGYQVTVQPEADELPEPLARFRPDLLARKADELYVVEVKARESLPDPKLQELANVVREQPGWRFELVLLKPESEFPGATPWVADDVEERLREVEAVLSAGHLEAALLLAWSAAEATLRLLAAKERLVLERQDAPYILRVLVTRAVITREEHQRLWGLLQVRNPVAHGLRPPKLEAGDVAALCALVSELLRQARPRRARKPAALVSD